MNALQLSRGFFLRPVNGLASASLVAAAFMMNGCGQSEGPDQTPAINETPASSSTPVDPTPLGEKLEPDDPAAGMNNRRPDSQKDLKPEPGSSQPAQ